MMPIVASWAAPEVVIMTNYGAKKMALWLLSVFSEASQDEGLHLSWTSLQSSH